MTEPRDTGRSGDGKPTSSLTSDLKARISRAKSDYEAADGAKAPSANRDMTGLGRGMRLGTEFIAAVLVGAGMGYLLDLWLGTSPWLLLVLLMVGFAAGVLNVVRSAEQMNRAAPPPTAAMRVPDDEDE